MLVAIVKKQLGLDLSLYQILQILSVTIFEKTPILQGFFNFGDELADEVLLSNWIYSTFNGTVLSLNK